MRPGVAIALRAPLLVVMVLANFFMQVGFMLLISNRLTRNIQIAERRVARANERAQQIAQRCEELAVGGVHLREGHARNVSTLSIFACELVWHFA